jgi:membrane-bound serine protease (ClpP class)
MANWIEVALLCIGFLLLMVEIFVIPGFGVAGFAGIVCIVGGLLAMWVKNAPDEIPWPKDADAWTILTDGLAAMALGFLAFLGVAVVLAKYMDRIPLLRSFVLKAAVIGKQTHVSKTSTAKVETSRLQIGQVGEVLSTLRPAGKVRFDDDIVDAASDGAFVEKGRQVQIQQIGLRGFPDCSLCGSAGFRDFYPQSRIIDRSGLALSGRGHQSVFSGQ